jgi:hypothetical protein
MWTGSIFCDNNNNTYLVLLFRYPIVPATLSNKLQIKQSYICHIRSHCVGSWQRTDFAE